MKNKHSFSLNNSLFQFFLPTNTRYLDNNKGTYENDTNRLNDDRGESNFKEEYISVEHAQIKY